MTRNDFAAELIFLEESLERFAYSLTANKEDAKDLVQDTYLRAFTYMGQFHEDTNLKAWTFTIMRNTFINNYRREQRHKITFDNSDNQYLVNSRPGQMTPESSFSHSEISRKVDQLEPEFRVPFQMHTSGYKYKEIAEKLNLKVGTVKSRIFFSRQKLMSVLKDYDR